MKIFFRYVVVMLAVCFISCKTYSQPSIEQFKQVFERQMQKLKPDGFTKRTIVFQSVVKGQPNGGYFPFTVVGYVHDYGPGYPANHYYGQTCLGKIDGLKYDLLKDESGNWMVQGRFAVTTNYKDCKDNPSEGAEAIPLASVPGTVYHPGTATATTGNSASKDNKNAAASALYIGQYASYGYGNRILAGMGFTLKDDGTYADIENKRGGTYTYDSKNATITFKGGFLGGQVGKNVKPSGFELSNTISCQPWR